MIKIINGFVVCGFFVLAACSGGEGTPTYSVSGKAAVVNNLYVDSDTNDPTLFNQNDNSGFENAQPISSFSQVYGFVTKAPTNGFFNSSDRLDENDIFSITLYSGQVVRLEVASARSDNDLGLFLYNENRDLIRTSIETQTGLEELEVTETGEYFIQVAALSGSSNYVLTMADELTVSNSSGYRNIQMVDLIPGEVIVEYENPYDMPAFMPVDLASSGLDDNLLELEKVQLPEDSSLLSEFELELRDLNYESFLKLQTIKAIKRLKNTPGIKNVYPNFRRQLQLVPNDPDYSKQWNLEAMNLPDAWDITTGSSDVIVAVIDTGVYMDHEDLQGQFVQGYDFVSDVAISQDGDGIDRNPDDPGDGYSLAGSSWHGTYVASILGAKTNNNLGLAGVSWNTKIMPLRVFGRGGFATSFDIIQAVLYAAGLENSSGELPSQRADIINLSLGGSGSNSAFAKLYRDLYDEGIIVVAAAGNKSSSGLSFPASYPGVFSVSALDRDGERALYSNYGSMVDIAAPGGFITAEFNEDDELVINDQDGIYGATVDVSTGSRQSSYDFVQGTSMSTPAVAGMFALMKSVYPSLTAKDVDALLQLGSLTDDLGNTGRDNLYGHGSANAKKAVEIATSLNNGSFVIPSLVSALPSTINLLSEDNYIVNIRSIGNGAPVFTGVSGSEAWLTAVAADVNSSNLGNYQINIDREGLDDGIYNGQLTFTFDTAPDVVVNVSMLVGYDNEQGVATKMYAVLRDVITSKSYITEVNNNLNYSFNNIPKGDYFLTVSSDIDYDGRLCDRGEVCGVYPDNLLQLIIPVTSDLTGIDVEVDVVTDVTVSAVND